ncbi:MAG TPA: AsmA-like C-terminal region-containing protein, partial [Candidatus Binatia bacterium]
SGIDFQNVRGLLVGFPSAVSGRWRYAERPQLLFDFRAPRLDITYLLSQVDAESSEFYTNLQAQGRIAIASGKIKAIEFGELQSDLTIDHRVWRLSNLTTRAAGGVVQAKASIDDRPDTLSIRTDSQIRGVPVQSFLRWFDMTTTEMTGTVNLAGSLETTGNDDAERKKNLNGAFNLKIGEGIIHRMRILVQILNLLDLSRWFTLQLPDLTKDGIRFRSIAADFKVKKGVYFTQNLVVDSDDLRMTGTGRIDVPKDDIDFLIAVRPFAGIDSAIHHIPLLGRGIAAIKNSFLVASFNIKGPIEEPTITPAPLGTLSEWFWGVLGIPKNAIGLGDNQNRQDDSKAAPR